MSVVDDLAGADEDVYAAEASKPLRRRCLSWISVMNVGQTCNGLDARLADHTRAGVAFDRVLYKDVPRADLDRIEGALLRALLPPLNTSAPVYRGGDNAVLEVFGMPTYADERAAAEAATTILRSRRQPYRTSRKRAA